jgi:hypothetical protein
MKFSRRKFITWFAIGTPLALALDAFGFERFFVDTNTYKLNKDADNKNPVNILQISDLHLQEFDYKAKRLAAQLNRLAPDIILFTGDAIDKRENIHSFREFLAAINQAIPKFAILGNWEYWGKIDLVKLKNLYNENNCKLLVNATAQILLKGKTISITGTDDFVGGSADIKESLTGYTHSDYHIILNHCPEYNDIIDEEISLDVPVDLILSGHTHGGQVNLLGFIPVMPPGSGRFIKGWYKTARGFRVYVSRGIGTSVIPARLGARAEVSMFEI